MGQPQQSKIYLMNMLVQITVVFIPITITLILPIKLINKIRNLNEKKRSTSEIAKL